jgi:hypothetical protein
MGKLETSLTWVLVILSLGYFIAGNCCKVQSNDQTNNGFSWSTASEKESAELEIITEDNAINVDSILEALQKVDSMIDAEEDLLENLKEIRAGAEE